MSLTDLFRSVRERLPVRSAGHGRGDRSIGRGCLPNESQEAEPRRAPLSRGVARAIDVSHLPPPLPMVRILETLRDLGPGETLLVNHTRRPIHLYPKLDALGCTHETTEVAAGQDRGPDHEPAQAILNTVILYQLSVFLHILSAIVWIGGMLFLALVVVPVTRGLPPAERAALFGAIGRRFRAVGWACIGVLLVTGTINTAYRGVTWENLFTAELWASPFGTTLALKLAVVVVMLGLSVYHDFVIGPRSVRALEQATTHGSGRRHVVSRSTGAAGHRDAARPDLMHEARRLRRHASVVGRLEAILALVVLALAIMLVRGVPLL